MRCEIIGVGTELLLGQIVNTNAAWIGQRLADVGWDCLRHTVVGDNERRIAETITEALGRADAVILTGGLGPTQDDVTREALAAVAGVKLVRQPELETWLRQRFGRMGVQRMAEMNLRQADVPEGARTIDNPRGTAPGLILEIDTVSNLHAHRRSFRRSLPPGGRRAYLESRPAIAPTLAPPYSRARSRTCAQAPKSSRPGTYLSDKIVA